MRSRLKKTIDQHKEKVEAKRLEPQTTTSPETSFVLQPLTEGEVEYFETQIGVSLKTDRALKPQTAAEYDAMICESDMVDWDGPAMSALVPLVDDKPVRSVSEQQNLIGVSISIIDNLHESLRNSGPFFISFHLSTDDQ